MTSPLCIAGSIRRHHPTDGGIPRAAHAVRVPRIARLMALAIRFDHLLAAGMIKDRRELARLGKVSRARISQILGLLNLAPDLQERVLFLSYRDGRRVRLGDLLAIAAIADWQTQRRQWRRRGLPISSVGAGGAGTRKAGEQPAPIVNTQ